MTRRTYLDFDLQITRTNDGLLARVLHSPAGQASVQIETSALDRVIPAADWPAWQTPAVASGDDQARLAGQALFQALFRDELLVCWGQSLIEARHSGCGPACG